MLSPINGDCALTVALSELHLKLGAGFKGDIFYSYRGQSTKMPFNDTSSETWRKPDFTGDIFHSCYCVKSTEMVV